MTPSYNLRNKNTTNKKDAEKKAEKEKMMKHQKLKKSKSDDGDGDIDIEFEIDTEDDSDDYETEYETEDESDSDSDSESDSDNDSESDSDNDAGDEESESEDDEQDSDAEDDEEEDSESDENKNSKNSKKSAKSSKSKKDQSFDELLASIFPSNYTREKAKKSIKSRENTDSTESLVKRALGFVEKGNSKKTNTNGKTNTTGKATNKKSEKTENSRNKNSKKCEHDYGEEEDEDLIDDIIRHMKAKKDKKDKKTKKDKKAKKNKNRKKNRDSDAEESDIDESEEETISDTSVTNEDDEEEEDEDYTPPKEGKKSSKSSANDNIFMTITYDDDYYDETENIEEILYADTECNSEDEKTFMSDVYEKVSIPILDNAEKSNGKNKDKHRNKDGGKDKSKNKSNTKDKHDNKGKNKDKADAKLNSKNDDKPKKESKISKLLKCLKETSQPQTQPIAEQQTQNTNQPGTEQQTQNITQPIAEQQTQNTTQPGTEQQTQNTNQPIAPTPTNMEQSKNTTSPAKGKKKSDKDPITKTNFAKINADIENEYKDLVLLKKQLAEKLETKPNSKILANAIKECDKEIKELILKTRRNNTEEYYNLSNTKPKHTGEFEYFKKKLSNKEQVKIMEDLTEVNQHIQVLKPYKLTLLQSNIPAKYKATVMQKLNMLQSMEPGDSEYHKLKMWIDAFMRIPFNVYKDLSISINDGLEVCNNFMNNAKKTLDECTYGLDDAKMQILQLVGQWITNPNAMGTAIAIYGPKGTGKTSLSKEGISKIFGREFTFISLGGSGDSSYLEGHSYTYEGSSWGKIAQILIESKCMNPIIYFDELDKISDSPRGQEITGILTHLTDTTQNSQFKDKFFSEVDLDLSRCLFIFSYNDENAVNPILRDRMYRIQTKGYDVKEKTIIAKKYLLPKIREQVNFKEGDIVIPDDVIQYIISNESMTQKEEGVRNLKRCLEIIHTKLNLFRLMHNTDENSILGKNIQLKVSFPHTVTRAEVDILIKNEEKQNQSLLAMYV
jgi:ATP-dependent Lon protease